jgi:hypothetical protein
MSPDELDSFTRARPDLAPLENVVATAEARIGQADLNEDLAVGRCCGHEPVLHPFAIWHGSEAAEEADGSASARMASSIGRSRHPASIGRRCRGLSGLPGREVGIDGAPDDLWLAIERHGGRRKQVAKVADEHGKRGNRLRFPAAVVHPPRDPNTARSRPPQIRVDRDGERRQPLVGNREGLDVKAQRQITATGGRECPFTKHLREWRRHRVRPPHDRNRWVDSISNDGPRAVEDSGLQIRPPHTMSGHDSEFVPEPGGLFIQFLYEPRLDFLPQARNRILLFLRGRHELKLQRGNHPVKGGLLTESFANPPLVLVQEHAAELCEPWGGRRGC